jgi:superfamily II DNA or RNA helicase
MAPRKKPFVPASEIVTVLTPRGARVSKADLGEAGTRALKAELTVRPKVAKGYPPADSYPTFLESESSVFVPRSFARARFGAPGSSTITTPEPRPALEFAGELRPQQALAVEAYLAGPGEGTICLPCGGGKTCIALNIIARLGVKTAVIVHKEFLMNQWRERIEQFLPGASVGLIRGPKVDVADKDIVLMSLQSLTQREYGDSLAGFGLAILDEVHHLSARVFCRALRQTNFQNVLGLTATPVRKDGLACVFHWFLGDVVWKPESVVKRPGVLVRFMEHEHAVEPRLTRAGVVDRVGMITDLCEHGERTAMLARTVRKIIDDAPERCVLLLSERRAHLLALEVELVKLGVQGIGFYVGGMKETERKKTETESDVILASFSQCSEGADIPRLDTLVLCSPRSDVVQSVGRILRRQDSSPVVYDVLDRHFESGCRARRGYYRTAGFTLESKGASYSDDERVVSLPAFGFTDDGAGVS